jgi:hypothetical protein
MKLFPSIAALFLFVNCINLLLAQCVSHPPAENGRGGWRTHGGSGYIPVIGNPYTAVFHERDEWKSSDGTIELFEGDTREARDSSGRTYREVKSGGIVNGHSWARVDASVMDPVCGLLIVWNTNSKVATTTHMVWSSAMQKNTSWLKPAVPETRSKNGVQTKVEDIGAKMILGVKALGTRYTSIVPAGSEWHTDKPVVVTNEKWVAPDLETFTELTSDDPRRAAVHSTKMIRLDRSEPDSTLFRIPADYSMKDRYINVQP